jgi:hypothetical protein
MTDKTNPEGGLLFTTDALDDIFRDLIKKHGYALQATCSGDDGPNYAYTIGRTDHGHLDVLFRNMTDGGLVTYLNEIIQTLSAENAAPTPGAMTVLKLNPTTGWLAVVRNESADVGRDEMLGCYNERLVTKTPERILVCTFEQGEPSTAIQFDQKTQPG